MLAHLTNPPECESHKQRKESPKKTKKTKTVHSANMNESVQGTPPKVSNTILYGTPKRVKLDHAYSNTNMKQFRDVAVQTYVKGHPKISKIVSTPVTSTPVTSPQISPVKSNRSKADNDPDYLPDPDSLEPKEINLTTNETLRSNNSYYIVSSSCLNELFKYCSRCGGVVTKQRSFATGSMLTNVIECSNGCSFRWRSHSVQHRKSVGNMAIVSACETTGLTYERLRSFAAAMQLVLLGRTTYCQINQCLHVHHHNDPNLARTSFFVIILNFLGLPFPTFRSLFAVWLLEGSNLYPPISLS